MENPWKTVDLADYENHMRLDSVYQLQTLNKMMKDQLSLCAAGTVMILGIAGGNGLEHIDKNRYRAVYGVDINLDYLQACRERYPELENVFKPICADLMDEELQLPGADLLVADLLIEYIGYGCFERVVEKVCPKVVSCIIQLNREASFVSESPYLHAFDRLTQVHHQMEAKELTASMKKIGYVKMKMQERSLPNGKQFVRIDFVQERQG